MAPLCVAGQLLSELVAERHADRIREVHRRQDHAASWQEIEYRPLRAQLEAEEDGLAGQIDCELGVAGDNRRAERDVWRDVATGWAAQAVDRAARHVGEEQAALRP